MTKRKTNIYLLLVITAFIITGGCAKDDDYSSDSFKDPRDGNIYETVSIGSQVWMTENLRYLPGVVDPGTGSYTTPCYYVYGYDGTTVDDAKATENYSTYGVLYNWPAVMNGDASSSSNPSGVQGVCPTGWHIPSDTEWAQLATYLGGNSLAGGKLKETGATHWLSQCDGTTNETGFTALPGGHRNEVGSFSAIQEFGYLWSATEYNSAFADYRRLNFITNSFEDYGDPKEKGHSVRCIKD